MGILASLKDTEVMDMMGVLLYLRALGHVEFDRYAMCKWEILYELNAHNCSR
jgi:hypothetical protein